MCKNSPEIGSSVLLENTHEQLLSSPERKGLLLQLLFGVYQVETNWFKEILVTYICTLCHNVKILSVSVNLLQCYSTDIPRDFAGSLQFLPVPR